MDRMDCLQSSQVLQRTREERERRRQQKLEQKSATTIQVLTPLITSIDGSPCIESYVCNSLSCRHPQVEHCLLPQAFWRSSQATQRARNDMRETWERLYGAEGDLIDRLVCYQEWQSALSL